jgi:hypothetical protein
MGSSYRGELLTGPSPFSSMKMTPAASRPV